jgi:exodeoxyribonuclease VIII
MSNVKVVPNMTNADYHADPALSSSGLKELAKSPAHYLEYRSNPSIPTASMVLGSAFHSALLEEGLHRGDVLLAPGNTRSTKIYKEFADQHLGKIILLEDEFRRVEGMVSAVDRHSVASALLKDGVAESSIFWTDPETGVQCKCRPDFLRNDGRIIDVKTTRDASVDAFQRSIMQFKYHWQSAWYLEGVSLARDEKVQDFIHLVVESEAPYGIGIYVLDDGSLDKAMDDIRRLRSKFANCLHTGEWESYPPQIQNISIPQWAFNTEVVE